ncbi:high-affinity nickel transport protein-like protein [Amylocarpus encephaloides]|uniref:Nickel/cobalt efflux system n=1 Tax=Amylocarpus encephaloides TaxID=45428 RepID=A0A9P8C5U4_9HELO|nr:high-affinity nickel transport protein-like protein [Amylocarpus encephaloides]
MTSPAGEQPLLEDRTLKHKFLDKATRYHERVPGIRRLPLPALGIISLLILINVVVWAAVGVVLAYHPALASTATLAYVLGLRHALDADHISAIDLMSRRLIAAGQKPVTVGTFFSLGHSTIVIITSIVVAATAAAISDRFDSFSRIGSIIGVSVSAAFLILLSIMNMYILYNLIKALKKHIRQGPEAEPDPWVGGGCLFHMFKRMFKLIDRPWKMYPLGVLFGLGFDTSSEVALLGIASIQAAKGTTIWLILLFPILFTAGMCLLDTTDGALMMTLYTSTALARDQIAILYYSIVLTVITVVVAMCIGVIQLLSLILHVAEPEGEFWDGVANAGDHYDVIGGAICGSFVVFGGLSVLVYGPWRRWVDGFRETVLEAEGSEGSEGSEGGRRGGVVEGERGIEREDASLAREPDKSKSARVGVEAV